MHDVSIDCDALDEENNTMNAPEEISLTDYQALAEFRYQIRRFMHFSEQMARSAGLEPQQHQMLLAIKGLPVGKKATIGELAERLQIQHHSAVELIDRLTDRGYVERRRDNVDQRRVLVHLTIQGEAILHQLSSIALAELRTTGPDLVHALNTLLIENGEKVGKISSHG
jgi:DNA-binding MarR family transcriptional regulator